MNDLGWFGRLLGPNRDESNRCSIPEIASHVLNNKHHRRFPSFCTPQFLMASSAKTTRLFHMTPNPTHNPLWMPYTQMKTAMPPLEVAATEGTRIHLRDGRTLIDGISSWWTACHGYNHPEIVSAIQQQAASMPHVMMGGLTHKPAQQLANSLADLLPGDHNKVFLVDSGSVAAEVAMKMAVQFWRNQTNGPLEKNRFVCFQNSYHGDTTGAMSVCDPVDSMHSHFKGFLLRAISAPGSPRRSITGEVQTVPCRT